MASLLLSHTCTSPVPAIKLWLNENLAAESTHYPYTMSWWFKIHLPQLLSPGLHNSFGQAFISRTDLRLITVNAKNRFFCLVGVAFSYL